MWEALHILLAGSLVCVFAFVLVFIYNGLALSESPQGYPARKKKSGMGRTHKGLRVGAREGGRLLSLYGLSECTGGGVGGVGDQARCGTVAAQTRHAYFSV